MKKRRFLSGIAAIFMIIAMMQLLLPIAAYAADANALAASVVPGTAVSSITISGLGSPAGLKYVYSISNSADAIPAQGAAIPTGDYGQYVPGVDIENVSAGKWLNLYDVVYAGEVDGVESYAVLGYYQKQLESGDIKAAASPDTVTDNGNTYTYTVADGKVTITQFTLGGSADITIPGTISGYPVTAIGTEAFKNKGLTSVIIPNGITSIGDCAFASNNLTSVTIPNSVTSIGEDAFVYNELTNIVIPNTVTSIGGNAFASNQLTSVTIPDSVTSIGDGAFFNNQLTNITIPDSVASIGEKTFCRNRLTSVTIPDSVTSIGEAAFAYNQLTSVTIPDSVTGIGDGAFAYNQLTSITIPDSVTGIGEMAFASNKLSDVIIENSTAAIGGNAFADNQETASSLKIHGYTGSTAQTYATADGHTFVALASGNADADILAAQAALSLSDISFSGTDSAATVTKNFALPLVGVNGTTITWSEVSDSGNNVSSDPATGVVTVTRPANGSGDAVVTLRATISKDGGASATKDFTFTILAKEPTGVWLDNAVVTEGTDYTLYGNTYVIKTATGLAWLAQQVNGGNSFSGKIIELDRDIDISDHYWTPIGTQYPYFEGIFDGKGHKITGLYIGTGVGSPGSNGFEGLFATIAGTAEVKNLGIESAEIYAGLGESGGILTGVNYGKITNCHTKGEIIGANGVALIGGLVGSNEEGLIANSYSTADVAVGNYVEPYTPAVGGLVGRNVGSRSYGVIVDCFATGNVNAGSGAFGNEIYAGGIAGENNSKGRIENSFATGNITGGANAKIGGIVGFLHNGFQQVPNVKNVYWNSDAIYTLNGSVLDSANKKGAGYILQGSDTTTAKIAADMKVVAFKSLLNSNIISSTSVPNIIYFAWDVDVRNENNGYPVITNIPINAYTITYNSNGATSGSAPSDSSTYLQGDTVTVQGNTGSLIRTGYTFSGWNTAADGSGSSYSEGATFTMGAANVTLYAKWTATGGSGNSGGSSGNSSAPVNYSDISVNGQTQGNAATIKTEKGTDGRTTTTVILDEKKVGELLDKLPDAAASTGTAQNHTIITISVSENTDTAVGELNGQTVKDMEKKDVILEVKTEKATYSLPAQQIDISAVSQSFGQDVKLSDIKVQVEIAKAVDATVKLVEDSANKGNFALVVPPVEFNIKCTYGSKTVEVSRFNSYVDRFVAIPDGIEPEKITTGVIVDPDGTVRHVPTKVIVIDGKYYAQINSLTNSTYSVIWHPLEFMDITDHWAKEAVNDMGSRMIISGTGNDKFEPDRDITRAEFAAIIVRALGLKPGTGGNPFSDVSSNVWYCDYVKTATEYKLISGYGNGKFGPNDKLTREQAATIIARAMNITGLKVQFADGEMIKLLAGFSDAAKLDDYAKNSIAACIKAGIISGRDGNLIAPKDNITRAEVAAIVRRLLQKSELI